MKEKYSPIFTNPIVEVAEQWKMIRKFIENWCQIPLAHLEQTNEFEAIEQELEMTLPESFREYINLSIQLLHSDSQIFRDCFEVEFLEEFEAISLMLQGEGDFYWAVLKADLNSESPKVHGYILDVECLTEDKFEPVGALYPSITSFFLNYLIEYLHLHKGSGFGVQINETEAIYQHLKSAFENHAKFEDIEIFESENMIAFMRNNGHTFSFHLWNDTENPEIPSIISTLVKNKKWSYGNFGPKF